MNPVALPSRFFLFGDKDKKFLRKHQIIWKKNEFGDTKLMLLNNRDGSLYPQFISQWLLNM